MDKCDPEHLDITVYNDRNCQHRNDELTLKAKLSDK